MKSLLPMGWKRVSPNSDPLAPTDQERFYDQRAMWEQANPNWRNYFDMAL